MEYIIVGTAGHVDHGKTVLVSKLTGINTDRLEEEKKRGISIKLGFAPLKLPSGRLLGLVDVPGHEKFIKEMLAGIGGMDLVMLIVAADEGVMPQTQEHLDIIDLLQIKKGLVVITKKDLVDEEWLQLVKEDIKEALQGTVLEGAPIVAVSAQKGEGLDELISLLDKLAAETPGKDMTGKVRLPIDRAFTVSGFGTVVTGTLWSGKISVGDTLEIQPGGQSVRVRGLQVHEKQVEEAFAGQRVAVNLASLQVSDVPRGGVLLAKDYLKPSYRLDAKLKLVSSIDKPLKNRARVRVHLGTSENLARVSILEKEELQSGEESFVQLLMEKPLLAARGDRFVIRSYSPMHTIGGGEIIEPQAKKLKRFRPETIEILETKLMGSPEELIEQHLDSLDKKDSIGKIKNISEIAAAIGMSEEETEKASKKLVAEEKIKEFEIENIHYYMGNKTYNKIMEILQSELKKYHDKYHLRPGLSKEELRSRYFNNWSSRQFNELLTYLKEQGKIEIKGSYVSMPDFKVIPSDKEKELLKKILEQYEENKFKPPGWEELMGELNIPSSLANELQQYLQYKEDLVKIAPDILLHNKWLDKAKEMINIHLEEKGEILLSEARDLLESSRKYVLPLLEYFDSIKFTKRVGDKRIKARQG